MHNHVILPSKLKHTYENHRKTLLTYPFSPVNSYSSVLFHSKLQKDIYLIFLSFSLTLTPNRLLVHFETTLSKWSVSFVLPNSRINSQSSSNLICWHAPHKIQRQMILWLFCSSCQTVSFQELKSAYLKSAKAGPCSDFWNTTEKAYPLLQAGFSTIWESPVSRTSTPFPWTSHVFNGFPTISRINHDLNARRNYLSLHLFKQQMFLVRLVWGTILYNGGMAVSKTDISPALRELT